MVGIQDFDLTALIALVMVALASLYTAAVTFINRLKGKKPEAKPAEPSLIGITFMQVWEGYGYKEHAIINWEQWIQAYGWAKVVIGAVPRGLLTVQFTDNSSASFIHYDRATNTLYADPGAPKFREIAKKQEAEKIAADYRAIRYAASPGAKAYEILGEAYKEKILAGLAGEARAVAWANHLDGKTPDDLALAVKYYLEATGYEPSYGERI